MILVTGASGFVGQHLVRQLSAQGKAVRALYRNTLPGPALQSLPGILWQQADLLDIFEVAAVMTGIDEVYHCAAIVSFDPARKEEMMHQNVECTINIVNAALDEGIRKLLYVSSIAALGRSDGDTMAINEDTEWEESSRNSVYSMSKYQAEMEVWRGIAEGLEAVMINPGIILGEGDWNKGSAKLMQVVDGEFPFYTRGINSFVDVMDVVRIMITLMESPIQAERFIVSAGNFEYRDIFTKMADALGKKPPSIKASPLLTNIVARWTVFKSKLTGTEPTITPETARTAQTKCYYNNDKLLKALPDFRYRPIAETIQRMAAAYKLKDLSGLSIAADTNHQVKISS